MTFYCAFNTCVSGMVSMNTFQSPLTPNSCSIRQQTTQQSFWLHFQSISSALLPSLTTLLRSLFPTSICYCANHESTRRKAIKQAKACTNSRHYYHCEIIMDSRELLFLGCRISQETPKKFVLRTSQTLRECLMRLAIAMALATPKHRLMSRHSCLFRRFIRKSMAWDVWIRALYSRKVLIEHKSPDILPEWLRFLKGVVDSEDLPLAINRERLKILI